MSSPSPYPCPGMPPGAQPRPFLPKGITAAILLCATVFGLSASVYVQHLTLDSLCAKANRILRGTVLKVTEGQIQAGGGVLPTITYKLKVTDALAGTAGDVVNITMIAEPKSEIRSGDARRLPVVEVPQLEEGKDYLLFTTKPSRIGLTSPVGLAQGCFTISKKGDTDVAVNGVNNVGLGLGVDGPIAYEELARRIRALRPE